MESFLASTSRRGSATPSDSTDPSSLVQPLPKKAELTLSLLGDTVAYITAPRSLDDPGRDAKIAGTVTLRLPKVKKIKRLTLEFVGAANLTLESTGYERGDAFAEKLLLLEEQTLVAGEHSYVLSPTLYRRLMYSPQVRVLLLRRSDLGAV